MKKKEKSTGGNSFFKFLFNSRYVIASFVIGALLGVGIMQAFIPTQIATLSDDSTSIALWGEKDKNGNYSDGLSANELYENLKTKTDISAVLDLVDAKLLEADYPYEEYKVKATDSANEYMKYYNDYYGLDEASFLSYYGFTTKEAFIEYLTLDTQRSDYFSNKIKSGISEKEIKSFYKKDVFGDIKIGYVSVAMDDESEMDEALIKEIVKKVKKGSTYEDLQANYKDSSDVTTSEVTISFDGAQEKKLVNAVRKLKNGEHTSSYIKTDTYGYVILFRKSSEDKPEYDEVKDLIPDIMLNEMATEDQKLFTRTLIELRKENGLTFTDTNFSKAYKKYVNENK